MTDKRPANHRDHAREALQHLSRAIEALTRRPATAEAMRQFEQYLDLLVRWNRSQRLTGARSPAAMVEELFEDSLLFLGKLPAGAIRVVDIGAGAGIPGIPIAILRPGISMTLIDAKRKRVSFLLNVKRELGIGNVQILEGRAEKIIETEGGLLGAFDAAVSRAVSMDEVVPLVRVYLNRDGIFVGGGAPSMSRQLSYEGMDVRYETTRALMGGRRRTLVVGKRVG